MHYPDSLHELHNDFPLAPYTSEIMYNDLSPKNKEIYAIANPSESARKAYKSEKLLCDFHSRKKYVTHYRLLLLFCLS